MVLFIASRLPLLQESRRVTETSHEGKHPHLNGILDEVPEDESGKEDYEESKVSHHHCSVSVSSSTTRPKTSAILVSGSMIQGSPSTANHCTRNKVVVAIKYSLIHYFTICNSGYQEELLYFLCCPTHYVPIE